MKNKFLKILMLVIFGIFVFWFGNYVITRSKTHDNRFQIVKDRNEYYDVLSGVNKFYQFYNDLFLTEDDFDYGSLGKEELDDEHNYTIDSSSVYALLDEEYLTFSGITQDNLIEKIEKHKRSSYIQVDSIYRICKQDKLSLYYIKATLIDKNNLTHEEIEFLLKKYEFNNTFSIYLSDYIQNKGYNNLLEGQKTNIKLFTMRTNIINLYEKSDISDTDYAKDLFNDFKKKCLDNREYAYSLLDDEVKNSKFDTFEKFNDYIVKNMTNIVTMKFNGCNVSEQKGVSEYTCYDNKNNKYIFKTSVPMKYKVSME